MEEKSLPTNYPSGYIFVPLIEARGIGNREPQLRKCLQYIGLWSIFLVNDLCGKAQPSVGGANIGQVVLVSIR